MDRKDLTCLRMIEAGLRHKHGLGKSAQVDELNRGDHTCEYPTRLFGSLVVETKYWGKASFLDHGVTRTVRFRSTCTLQKDDRDDDQVEPRLIDLRLIDDDKVAVIGRVEVRVKISGERELVVIT